MKVTVYYNKHLYIKSALYLILGPKKKKKMKPRTYAQRAQGGKQYIMQYGKCYSQEIYIK